MSREAIQNIKVARFLWTMVHKQLQGLAGYLTRNLLLLWGRAKTTI